MNRLWKMAAIVLVAATIYGTSLVTMTSANPVQRLVLGLVLFTAAVAMALIADCNDDHDRFAG